MAIDRVEIKDFLVFKGEFAVDFCPGVNVLIGANATGKTTLMREIYRATEAITADESTGLAGDVIITYDKGDKIVIPKESARVVIGVPQRKNFKVIWTNIGNRVFIPEKDILEHAKGLLTFIEDKQTGFGPIYRDVLIKAQDVPTNKQSETQQNIGKKISDIIGGEVKWDKGDGSFYTIRTNGDRIPFANEASGFKKLGFLGLLVACGQLEKNAVLFWDEPENSLNPELMPVLVEILFELQRGGVQIFIATHSYNLARWFDVKRDSEKGDEVMFYNLSKSDNGSIECVSAAEYTKLPESILDIADEKLFKAVVADAMGIQEDE